MKSIEHIFADKDMIRVFFFFFYKGKDNDVYVIDEFKKQNPKVLLKHCVTIL